MIFDPSVDLVLYPCHTVVSELGATFHDALASGSAFVMQRQPRNVGCLLGTFEVKIISQDLSHSSFFCMEFFPEGANQGVRT